MNDYVPIDEVVEKLRHEFDWPHSFIRECYLASKHCQVRIDETADEGAVGDVSGQQYARVLVASAGNPAIFGIEFLFGNVHLFSMQTFEELAFECTYDRHAGYCVRFANPVFGRECWISAEKVLVRFLGQSYLGPQFRLGEPVLDEDVYDSAVIEGNWRQCKNCHNIWQLSLDTQRSRCPECGVMTELKNLL